jgi:hypothetical protein
MYIPALESSNRQYNKGGDSQEEYTESDEEDWRMQVKDEDECDGIKDQGHIERQRG